MIQNRVCKDCGRSFQGGPRAYYCPSCRITRTEETNKQYKRTGPQRPLGSLDKCERCGKDYIVASGLQRFCPECRPIHSAEHDRQTGLEFYHENKDRINPPRNVKRQAGIVKCIWCGKEFMPHNRSKACSPECRRELKNKWWREYDKKRRG